MGIRNIEAQPVPPSWEQFVQGNGFLSGQNITDLAKKNDFAAAIRVVTDYAGQMPKESRPTTLNDLLGLVDWANPKDRQQFKDAVIKLQELGQTTTPPHA